MKRFFYLLSFVVLFLSQPLRAQNAQLHIVEDSLIRTADSMYNAFVPELRQHYCETFVRQLVRALKTPDSYKYPFKNLDTVINIIYSDDHKFRIFNWAVLVSTMSIRYYGAIQMDEEQLKLYPFRDYTLEIGNGIEDSILTGGKWYGAIIYDIISHEVNGKTIYTLIGKNASNVNTNIKVLDPMYFTDKGPVFGAPIFNKPGKKVNRFVLEYRKDVNVSMKWDKEYNAITFDRLISQMNDPKRKNTFVPTGQYDGFKWDNEKWNFIEDVIPVQVFKDGEAPVPQPVSPKQ